MKTFKEIREACWKGYKRVGGKMKNGRMVPNCVPVKEETLEEKNVPTSPEKWARAKAAAKKKFSVYPSAYANGWAAKKYKAMGGGWKSVSEESEDNLEEKWSAKYKKSIDCSNPKGFSQRAHCQGKKKVNEDLRKWFRDKWVRFDTNGNIKGDCAREPGEGKPKCLPQAKAHSLGKQQRAKAARRKRREDPNPERKGKAIFVKTR